MSDDNDVLTMEKLREAFGRYANANKWTECNCGANDFTLHKDYCYMRFNYWTIPGPGYGLKCECGSKAPVGQNHSKWCDCFKSEF